MTREKRSSIVFHFLSNDFALGNLGAILSLVFARFFFLTWYLALITFITSLFLIATSKIHIAYRIIALVLQLFLAYLFTEGFFLLLSE